MIRNVHCSELRKLIAKALKVKETNQDRIDDFIVSSNYFDRMIQDFLLSEKGYWQLDDEDVKGFSNNLKSWIQYQKTLK